FRLSLILIASMLLSARVDAESPSRVIISVRDQKLMLVGNGERLATYPVSTSKFGLGDDRGRMTTPLGFLQVAQKIGDHAPLGAIVEIVPDKLPKVRKAPRGATFTLEAPKVEAEKTNVPPAPEKAPEGTLRKRADMTKSLTWAVAHS